MRAVKSQLVKQVKAWQTSDGRLFLEQAQAEAVERDSILRGRLEKLLAPCDGRPATEVVGHLLASLTELTELMGAYLPPSPGKRPGRRAAAKESGAGKDAKAAGRPAATPGVARGDAPAPAGPPGTGQAQAGGAG